MSSISMAIILLLIHSWTYAERICPRYGYVLQPENCISTCSSTNDQCPRGTKCCYRLAQPCGFHCIIPKNNIKKAGQCPAGPIADPSWFICDAFDCNVDNDCQGTKKCCPNSCGAKICLSPKNN